MSCRTTSNEGRAVRLGERIGLAVLHRLDPETAHGLSLVALRAGLAGAAAADRWPRLAVDLAGIALPNPIGLAAGYDKNARAIGPLLRAGFGFVELGAATPRPQPGNPRPRLFRLAEDRAAINRMGFNNDGAEAIARRLAAPRRAGVVGLNLGTNKGSPDRTADYAAVVTRCGAHVDFVTVNVSSPNTERLRDLQGRAALAATLAGVLEARAALVAATGRALPVFLKIAPDLGPDEIADIAEVALEARIEAIIATNTTLGRDGLRAPQAVQAGGLSGRPLFEASTRVLAQLARCTQGRVALVGTGGIGSAEDAYAKIRAGATAVQLYTALVYEGLSLVPRIAAGLDALLARDGFATLAEAVGTGTGDWL
jgi:dihydroorotate dehydrogenase